MKDWISTKIESNVEEKNLLFSIDANYMQVPLGSESEKIKDKDCYTSIPFDLNSTVAKNKNKSKMIYIFTKRFFDLILSSLALIILSPFLIIVSIIIKVSDNGPILYRAKRIGKDGKIIKVAKFRSMSVNAEKLEETLTLEQLNEYYKNYKLDYDPRITKFGNFIRKTSIDELPQLFDIFVGKMSIVGPRPVLEEETQLYGEDRTLFLSVKPGLTGLWQAYGRSNITYESGKRQLMELYYVNNRSFLLDVRIILKTVSTVLTRNGAK